jgi:hypothetical protein
MKNQRSSSAMDKYLSNLGLWRKPIARDGFCLFRATSEQVSLGYGAFARESGKIFVILVSFRIPIYKNNIHYACQKNLTNKNDFLTIVKVSIKILI